MEARLRSPLVSQILRPPALRLGPRATSALMYGASLVLFLGFWELMATYFYSSVLFPTPVQTVHTFFRLAVSELPGDVAVSLGRVVTGFAIGGVVGAILGLSMGSWAPIRSLFEPYVHFLRFIPPIAWFTPAVIWFGIGEESKVFLIVYTTTFVVLLNTLAGVEAVPTKRMLVARMFGATALKSFTKITVPSALPYILMGLRLASGNSFMTLVAAEMLGANRGIGFLIINARLWSATDQVFCGMFVLGCMGYGTDLLIRWCIRRWAWRYMPQHQNR